MKLSRCVRIDGDKIASREEVQCWWSQNAFPEGGSGGKEIRFRRRGARLRLFSSKLITRHNRDGEDGEQMVRSLAKILVGRLELRDQ